jgi:hypothetical protein
MVVAGMVCREVVGLSMWLVLCVGVVVVFSSEEEGNVAWLVVSLWERVGAIGMEEVARAKAGRMVECQSAWNSS